MKKAIIKASAGMLGVCLLLSAAACGAHTEDGVYAQSLASLNGMLSSASADRFAGVAVSGKTVEIKLDESLTLEEIKVTEGQLVHVGDVLFTYNNDSAELSVEQAQLELESLRNKISTANQQIAELTKERDAAASADKLGYTLEIQSLQADIRETEFTISVKEKELENLRKTAADTEVRSEIDGRVTEINPADSSGYQEGEKPFMTVVETGSLRVKGYVNEMNRGLVYEGMRVTLRSRTDPLVTWSGEISVIDWENAEQSGGSGGYYGGYSENGEGEDMTVSSKYPFYVSLDDAEGMIIGQHLYIEPGETDAEADGLRIPAAFVTDADSDAWVWVAGSGGRLEKRSVSLGEYSEVTDDYTVEGGLTADDYVVFPEDGLKPGMKTVKTDDSAAEYYPEDDSDGLPDDFSNDEAYPGDGEYYADDAEYFADDSAEESPRADAEN